MQLQCFILLVFFTNKSHGLTKFIYAAKDEEELSCESSKWQISAESDSIVSSICVVKCIRVKPSNNAVSINIAERCKDQNQNHETCLDVQSGFFACVTALNNNTFLYPFKPPSSTVTAYIVAIADLHMTTMPELKSHVEVAEGDSVDFNCSFTLRNNNNAFTVYWIKTVKGDSTCVYYYDFGTHDTPAVGLYCNVHKELLNRLSNRTINPSTHDIVISNMTGSDSGQYLCALHLHKGNKGEYWKIIQNITVNVRTTEVLDEMKSHDGRLWYATVPILVCIVVAAVVLFLRRSTAVKGSKKTQIQSDNSSQNGEATNHADCSPYAVGVGEEESNSRANRKCSKKSETFYEEIATSPYSLLQLNDLYDSGA